MQKIYSAKLRQKATENYLWKFKGNVEDLEFTNLPAPMKLCVKAIDSIKDFRVSIEHLHVLQTIKNGCKVCGHWLLNKCSLLWLNVGTQLVLLLLADHAFVFKFDIKNHYNLLLRFRCMLRCSNENWSQKFRVIIMCSDLSVTYLLLDRCCHSAVDEGDVVPCQCCNSYRHFRRM
jgi:hypothetical protein